MANNNIYQLGESFITKNYLLWDTSSRRSELQIFYKEESLLSFDSSERANFRGGKEIYEGVFNLISHAPTKHEIASIDIQGDTTDDMIVLVTGKVFVGEGSQEPLYFSEAFHLKGDDEKSGDGEKGLYILRDIIRITKVQ